MKRYASPIHGKALQGHVFKTLHLEKEELCRINCYLEEICQSYNVASSPHLGGWECELSNTDDKQHPESLVTSPGKIYRATQVPCVISRTRRVEVGWLSGVIRTSQIRIILSVTRWICVVWSRIQLYVL